MDQQLLACFIKKGLRCLHARIFPPSKRTDQDDHKLWVFFWLQIFARIPEPIRGQMYLQVDRSHEEERMWIPMQEISGEGVNVNCI
jgi:hypothetical protein